MNRNDTNEFKFSKFNSDRFIFVVGEKVDFKTISNLYREFKTYGLEKKMITQSYGLTESTLTVSAKDEDKQISKVCLLNTNLEIGNGIEIDEGDKGICYMINYLYR